ncbi:MAG: hypothetical protein KGJ35_01665 [Patescibacteria group bacterium]|nr:hypothetical protein [Patescibacteria group bacterium]
MMKKTKFKVKNTKFENGDILVSALVFAAVALTIIVSMANWGAAILSGIRTTATKEQGFQIAEAGIDYYRWHLAQYPTDYKDGTATSGPYYHSFYDKNNNIIGGYSLSIVPPPLGSTKVVITSTATTTANPGIKKIVQATLAEPSLAQYAVVANDYMRFGAGTTINGPITSNHGIHFDTGAVANNVISSALATDTDPDSGQTEWGVWTDADPAYNIHTSPPTNSQGVFLAGRQYPVPAIDFTGLTLNLANLKSLADSTGYDFAKSKYTSGHSTKNGVGYHMVLSPPNISYPNGYFTLYVVTATVNPPNWCGNDYTAQNQAQWGTWSIQSETPYTLGGKSNGIYAIPSNGIIFFQDNVWVDGQINNERLTIATGILPDPGPSGEPSINVGGVNPDDNGNLLYTNFNGNDTIGLIAQGNINVPLASPDTVTIDAALMAENGRVGRYYYSSYCTLSDPKYPSNSSNRYYYTRSILNNIGMIATNERYGFAYTDNTGYDTRNLDYDGNLLYSPPPNFPLASTQYQTVSWKQLQ